MEYEFHTTPFDHQRRIFNAIKDDPAFAIFWEQGTGKSKLSIDKACYLYETGQIDAVFIVAPQGVHRNWITDEIPAHCPPRFVDGMKSGFYRTKKISTKWHQKEIDALMNHKGLVWFAMTYDAIKTEKGKKYAVKFLKTKRCLFIGDEITRIKTPKAKVTKAVHATRPLAPFALPLSGTPVANGPFDLFSIMRFVDPDFWRPHQLSTFTAFKHHFGIFQKQVNLQTGQQFEILLSYKNVDQLYDMIQWCSSRVLKEDVLDLPPKLYSNMFFEMEPEQRALYNELKTECMVWLDNGELVTAALAIVRLIRLQQITCGYIPWDNAPADKIHLITDKNPRLQALSEICKDLPHSAIIWARFTKDIDLICEMLGDEAARYDGQTDDDERALAKDQFQNGEKKYFVATPASASEGLTLTAAKTVIYYNNSFKLQERLQSEDRAHRYGQDKPVHYIDIQALNTVDTKIVSALRQKKITAATILGDEVKEWI